jgi:hypothetical protein
MANTGAKVVIGVDVTEVKPKLDSVSMAVVQAGKDVEGSFQGWVGAADSAGHATDSLYVKMKELKGEATQHQRVFKFYGTQLAELLPISKEVGAGLAGIFAGVGSGMWVMAAIEAVKVGMATFGEGAKEATKEAEELRKKVVETAVEIAQLGRELAGLRKYSGPELERNTLERLKANAEGFAQEAGYATDPGEKMLALNRAAQDRAEFEKRGGDIRLAQLREQIKLQGRIADNEANKKAAEEEEIKRKKELLEIESRRVAAIKLISGIATQQMAGMDEEGRPLSDSERSKMQAELDKERNAAIKQINDIASEQLAGTEEEGRALSPDKVHKLSQMLAQDAAKLKEGWTAVGETIGSAFTSMGQAIGGAAGQIVSDMGKIISQTLALVVALAFSDTLMTGPLGVFAAIPMAAGILAAAVGMIGGISARADGGPVSTGRPYLVGERGPELFSPSQNGSIAAAGTFGGGGVNVTFNAPVDQAWWRANERHIVRTIREASRAGRA